VGDTKEQQVLCITQSSPSRSRWLLRPSDVRFRHFLPGKLSSGRGWAYVRDVYGTFWDAGRTYWEDPIYWESAPDYSDLVDLARDVAAAETIA
jgi:hypothetical protein